MPDVEIGRSEVPSPALRAMGHAHDLALLDASHAPGLEEAARDPALAVAAGFRLPLRPGWGACYCAAILDQAARGAGFALTLLHHGAPIGCARLFGIPELPFRAELGIWVHAEHRRLGHARHAVAALVASALRRWPLRRLDAWCLEENGPGRRLLEGIGLRGDESGGARARPATGARAVHYSADRHGLRALADSYRGRSF